MKTIVPEFWNVPEQIRERFGETAGRQRAMFADGHLLLVLHAPPSANERERSARLFWRDPEGVWLSNQNGSGAGALRRHLSDYTDLAAGLENILHGADCADDYFQALSEVTPLHRAARNLHSTLQQAREMVSEDKDIIVVRDAAADVERTLELLHLDAKNGLDYTIAQKSEQQSQRSYEMALAAHRLNLLAALFFPITAISSVFGMNLPNGLEGTANSSLFWGILCIGLSFGLMLTKLITEKPPVTTEAKPHRGGVKAVKQSKGSQHPVKSLSLRRAS